MRTVVFVDDAEEDLQALQFQFADHYKVIPCSRGADAGDIVKKERPSAVIVDIHMPGYDGFKVLSDLRSIPDAPPILMLSGHYDPFYVVRALKEGASDFMSKPYHTSMLRHRLTRIIEQASPQGTARASHAARTYGKDRPGTQGRSLLVGSSERMAKIRRDIASYAVSDLPILILGESGTGKELAAQSIHQASLRAHGPYVVRNISAIPAGLVESELFGCEKGAYTDACRRSGCFEEADGGSLFLDEIGDASQTVQTALLRVVEDGIVRRLGAQAQARVNCRLICATNRDLDELAGQARFRSDLKYRIEALTIRMPPLREHREDIPELVAHILGLLAQRDDPGKPVCSVSAQAMDFLIGSDWPGNVRQLASYLRRAQLLARNQEIEAQHLRQA
jgi:DNA-binding NtrC family response regulator